MVSSSKARTLTIVEEPSFNISEEHKTTENESIPDGDDSDATNPFLTHKPDAKAKKKPFASTYVPPATQSRPMNVPPINFHGSQNILVLDDKRDDSKPSIPSASQSQCQQPSSRS